MADKLGWGILGTGLIARIVARAIAASQTGRLVAVGSRTQAKAEAFGQELNVPRRYAGYAEVLADREVDGVYIALPNSLHAEWAIRGAQAGKHLLCEKPLTSNHAEAVQVIAAARQAGVFLMEAFMYRCHPQTAKSADLVRSGVLGKVQLLQSAFCFVLGNHPDNIRARADTCGGSIMDVGCYPVSLARLIAGAALGLAGPAEPVEVRGAAQLDPAGGVDTWAIGSLKFPGGLLASVTAGIQINAPATTTVYGTAGRMIIHSPWFPGTDEASARLEVQVYGEKEPRIHTAPGAAELFTLEVDTVARHLAARQAPAMTWADTLGNMQALDQWRKSVGVVFACDRA